MVNIMKSFNFFFYCSLAVLMAIALLLYGFYAIFAPKKISNLYRNSPPKNKLLNYFYELRKKKTEYPGFYFNLKLYGVIMILTAFFFLFAVIHAILNFK